MTSNNSILTPGTVDIRSIKSTDTIPLRHSVLWPHAPASYVCLPEDEEGAHLGAFVPGTVSPVCIISMFVESLPHVEVPRADDSDTIKAVRFRKFACDPTYQGQGIGTLLLQHVFLMAKAELLADVVWCDARLSSASWYEKRGMRPFGEKFWKGSIEYVRMRIDV
ncbi:GCN5-related N-acetyltransferase [Neolentinus lepideus HHB14362 ss-1]|uniref:GCN5-related N-acetyltransferase n=1 Tax=Neolentinus lepideus HHB14362 ss-1 TaxID=1314782 RepID=A0A165QT18_9AGAM|nr:GCN5-related N-acetyltransferase [Neolentinus lepideus HHB14362 ss-1]